MVGGGNIEHSETLKLINFANSISALKLPLDSLRLYSNSTHHSKAPKGQRIENEHVELMKSNYKSSLDS